MTAQELQGKTLGEKHRHYNQLVKVAVKGNGRLEDLNAEDLDVYNLIKIDIAAKKRDVEYILKVLQCEDMLYVSRAIKKSTWLVTEPQLSNIINPQYLHTYLFPQMMTKSRAKLLLNIRLNLRDEDRVDAFYNYVKEENEEAALKWLPYCSMNLAEKEVKKHHVLFHYRTNYKLFKRLCEKSTKFLEICIKDCDYPGNMLNNVKFLIKNNTDLYLDFVETCATNHVPSFGPRITGILMKSAQQRMLDRFEVYFRKLNKATFAKYLKPEQIQDLVTKTSQKVDSECFEYENLKHLVRHLPKEGRFDFLKKFVIQKKNEQSMETQDETNTQNSANIYRWYRFAHFEVAFAELTKVIRSESNPSERIAMLGILLSCAVHNSQHIQVLLQYYSDKHINEPFKFKIQFVNMLISKTETYKYDKTSWNILNNIFHSLEVYIESENNVQTCVEAIIVQKVLHNENVPEIIEKKFKFQTLKSLRPKLTNEEKDKVFNFLYKFLEKKINNVTVRSKDELTESVVLLEDIQLLFSDWKKTLYNGSWFLDKVKELIKIKNACAWENDLSPLYRKHKIWRRIMFEESLSLSPSNETCFNALKHNPELLSKNKSIVQDLFSDFKISLRQVLRALRVYWPQSLAAQWLFWYLDRLNQLDCPKAVIRGFCILAPQKQVINVAMEYIPHDFKINWNKDDQKLLSLRKYLAQNMHVTRPLLPLEVILSYAKGDYLQFALPSLLAVLHNKSAMQVREHISKLLDAPVSLKKHGIRSAFTKLESQQLKIIFEDIWKKPKPPSIRTILFKQTYDLLCRQTKPAATEEVWLLLSTFIDNLSTNENKIVYDILGKYDKVPMLVRGKFYMKSLMLLKSLPPHKLNYCENDVQSLMWSMNDMIEHLDPAFVKSILLESAHDFTTKRYSYLDIMASYLLCAKDEESQLDRYNNFLVPLIENSFALWNSDATARYWVSKNLKELLQEITKYFQRHVLQKKSIFPIKLFSYIQDELVKRLPADEYYEILTMWKLFSTFVKLLEEHTEVLSTIVTELTEYEIAKNRVDPYYYYDPKNEKKYNAIYMKPIPKFSKACLDILKDDNDQKFPSIYKIFVTCLEKFMENLNLLVRLECLKCLLDDEDFTPMYLVVLEVLTRIHLYDGITDDDDDKESAQRIDEIREKIFSNPSIEVKTHYYHKYSRHNVFNDS